MEIIPKPYADFNDSSTVSISKFSVTYTQLQDNNSPISADSEDQYLTIEAIGSDLGGEDGVQNRENYYYSISTDRWAFDNPKELYGILKDFEDRLYMGRTYPTTNGDNYGKQ